MFVFLKECENKEKQTLGDHGFALGFGRKFARSFAVEGSDADSHLGASHFSWETKCFEVWLWFENNRRFLFKYSIIPESSESSKSSESIQITSAGNL